MAHARAGDQVKIFYKGRTADGVVFDVGIDHEPLTLTLGRGEFPEVIEQAIMGIGAGETCEVRVPPDQSLVDIGEDDPLAGKELIYVISLREIIPA